MVGKWFENGLHMAREEFAVHLQQPGEKWILGLAESESEKYFYMYRRGKEEKAGRFWVFEESLDYPYRFED